MNEHTSERILKLVETELGKLSYQTCEFIGTGCEKDVIVLDKKTVILVYREGLQIDAYMDKQELIRRLSKHAKAVLPQSLHVCPTKNFVVEQYVPGHRMTPQSAKEHTEHAEAMGRSIGRFLRQLHQISKQGLNLQTRFAQDVQNDMEEGLRLLETKLTDSELCQVTEFLDKYYKMSESVQTCVVHGDFHYDNVFWDELPGRLGVIDFNEGGIEDPALDFMYMCYYPEPFRHAVFEEYGSPDGSLYERSQLYDKIYGLYDMVETLQNNPRKPDFQQGYRRFFGNRNRVEERREVPADGQRFVE
jgi:aminoglycoside phosphotransferase (APT) family kinase protein